MEHAASETTIKSPTAGAKGSAVSRAAPPTHASVSHASAPSLPPLEKPLAPATVAATGVVGPGDREESSFAPAGRLDSPKKIPAQPASASASASSQTPPSRSLTRPPSSSSPSPSDEHTKTLTLGEPPTAIAMAESTVAPDAVGASALQRPKDDQHDKPAPAPAQQPSNTTLVSPPTPKMASSSSSFVDLLSSPNSISSATPPPPTAFSPPVASPSPGNSTSPEADATLQKAQAPTREKSPVEHATNALTDTEITKPAIDIASDHGPSSPSIKILLGSSSSDHRTTGRSPPKLIPATGGDPNFVNSVALKPNLQGRTSSPDNTDTDAATSSPSPTRQRIVRPRPSRPRLQSDIHSLHSSETPRSVFALSRASSTRSVCSNAPLQHPTPELNAKSGAYTGNIAALEATAERFSMTSSIEDAIRDAHAQLKRRDSQRSVILANNLQHQQQYSSHHSDDVGSATGEHHPHLPFSRQLSIVSLNSGARSGGYSPSGYVMSPTNSLSMTGTRLRSASKASSTGPPSSVLGDVIPEHGKAEEDNVLSPLPPPPAFSRHGPGKSSVRSVLSNKLSLAEIAEIEPPTSLTQEALDKADRLDAEDEDETAGAQDQDTIRPNAQQLAQMGLDHPTPDANGHWDDATPNAEAWSRRPRLEHTDYTHPAERAHHHGHGHPREQPGYFPHDGGHGNGYGHEQGQHRPQTALSVAPSEHDHNNAFGDFDGVHCDPEYTDFGPQHVVDEHGQPIHQMQGNYMHQMEQQHQLQLMEQHVPPPPARPRPQKRISTRPQSYFDPGTGQEMVYYPAPVPAMLNLPPKLSKKPKTAQRHARYSKVLEVMAQENHRASRLWLQDPVEEDKRASRTWLPDPVVDGGFGESFMGDGDHSAHSAPPNATSTTDLPDQSLDMSQTSGPNSASPTKTNFPPQRELRRPAKLTDADKRKSRMSVMPSELPPQVRASAFFDVPSETPRIELKGGSAMETLDSILDASAKAPVSAFTDHAFAGKLGNEVYGAEKKSKKKHKAKKLSVDHQTRDSESTVREVKKKSSFLSIGGGANFNSSEGNRRSAIIGADGSHGRDSGSQKRNSMDGEEGVLSPSTAMLAPDADEESSGDESDGSEEIYYGAPTTLLAELQLRKQQQKLRTRPINKAHPNGLHTTLLELDAVAEVERRARKGKRINLAWEDPSVAQAEMSDDEDVPLAMLQAIRGNPTGDITAAVADINRPLGLMERREMEDNEPLSRRRDRLQGRAQQNPTTIYLNTASQTRASALALAPGAPTLPGHARQYSQAPEVHLAPDLQGSDEEEIEDEPLGDRMRRLKAKEDVENPLPLARPVSRAFSVELLGQLGVADPEEEKKKENTAPPVEEEETLGQRRRRLQAEREAREREMGHHAGALHALEGVHMNSLGAPLAPFGKKLSMADVLGAHPMQRAMGSMDPREAERLRLQAETERAAREHDEKMRAMRAAQQQQQPLAAVGNNPRGVGVATAMGIGATRAPSGFMGGRFNDGTGGGTSLPIGAAADGPGVGSWGKTMYGGQGYGGQQQQQYPVQSHHGMGGGQQYGGVPMMGTGMMSVPGPAQSDMVERWRQGVL